MKTLNIIQNRKKFYLISAAIILIGIVFMIFNGVSGRGIFNFSVEFIGGTSLHYDMKSDFNNSDLEAVVAEITGQSSPQVQKVIGTTEVMIKVKNIDSETRENLTEALIERFGITAEDLLSSGDVSPTVSSEMQRTAILAVLVSCAAMLLYVSFRFKNIVTGASAILALVHDALIVVAAYAIFRIPLDYSFIAAVLTVIGYSINATIVIFDRVRETMKTTDKFSTTELANQSVTQTMSRSLYTSLTTLFVIICLWIFGVTSVKDFSLPIIIGIIAGTYSSICLSVSFWFEMMKRRKKAD